uniref:Nucleoporin Nup133/Nup155-like N-terminal domain-containing protein n=1 Tax=Mucochytrium quahogii TaxID=96639 RepID=A0A7S2W9K2_9STRA|mmetsp:Transcript_34289/g.54922  ORF Transcript_34289/g.54922 Transcript_34289/m.54922 type:complete len:1697 (+) Transcript_34289:137-5227(+)|eukprot:CAMPEP_0203758716 /NCGR_PEP_ID=MMETSP0098-20131031/11532_1 /ASSEMBLY_ACC=CAM_ASM_000208 /TAXON_ID=96639 /ORGANISM=" , Strain NY0313808BC1" /LENGTH=1696 /DNA_ID=CAMNT_0050651261 /DNA_START=147 /DNA_END=5237 /DNA_ORIENTATION=+
MSKVGAEQDMFSCLKATASELAQFSSDAKQNGQEQLELSQLLKNARLGASVPQNYFSDKFCKFRVPGVGTSVRWLPDIESVDCRPVPRAIRNLYSQIECETFMGLFPEINRAWITIDNKLFLWNYYKGEDFYMYSGLDQLIVSIGLARPRPGVFGPDVEYVVVISTPVEIVLLKLRIIGHPVYGDIELEPTEFNLASDNVPMRSIAGTADGRIFMAGHDGSLYEFIYETPSMLHSLGLKRQCRKVELSGMAPVKWLVPSFIRSLAGSADPLTQVIIDHERDLLYTLSDRSALSLYRLPQKRKKNSSSDDTAGAVLVVSIDNLTSMVRRFVDNQRHPTARSGIQPQNLGRPIRVVSLNVVRKQESDLIHLVAVSDRGVRIYFSTNKMGNGKTLIIEHVRGPPNKEVLASKLKNPNESLEQQYQGGSTSLLARRLNQQGNTNQTQISSQPVVDKGIAPGPETANPVGSAMYAGGVTLLAFSPSGATSSSSLGSNNVDATQQVEHTLSSYCTDLAMREPHTSLLPAFPPVRWQQESFHEVIDVDVLEQGPILRQSRIEGTSLGTSGIRATQGLPVGRVWAMVEAGFDPTASDEEELVYAHMLHAPNALPTPKNNAATGNSTTNDENTNSLSGNKRRSSQISSQAQKPEPISINQNSDVVALTEIAKQYVLPRRYFFALTSHGLWVLVKNRPINELHALLQGPDPGTNADIEEFFKQYGLDESCGMCLAIACKTGYVDEVDGGGNPLQNSGNISVSGVADDGPFTDSSATDEAAQNEWVSRRAALWYRRIGFGIANLGPDSSAAAHQQFLPCFPEQLNKNTPAATVDASTTSGGSNSSTRAPMAMMNPASTGGASGFIHSGCYTGLSLYVSRLLRPFWGWSVVVNAEAVYLDTSDVPVLRCRFSPGQISMLARPLLQLKQFLKTQMPFCDAIREYNSNSSAQQNIYAAFSGSLFSANGPSSSASWGGSSRRLGMPRPNAQTIENVRVAQMYNLVDRAIQALLLFRILQSSHGTQLAQLMMYMNKEIRASLNEMTWEDMVTSVNGKIVATCLVKLLAEKSTDMMAQQLVNKLEMFCPAYFSEGDAMQISAFEEISIAEKSSQVHDRSNRLDVALERLKQGMKKTMATTASRDTQIELTQNTLRDACEKFERLGQPGKALDLALYCATCFATQPLDILPVRHIAARSGGQRVGPGGSFSSLESTNASNQTSTVEANSLAMREFCYNVGLQVLSRCLPVQDGTKHRDGIKNIMKEATQSQDALWHYTMYAWLLEKGLKSILLEIKSEFIVPFLGDPLANDPKNAGPGMYEPPFHVDMHLLLQVEWFGRHGDYAKAASVLQNLAKLDFQFHVGEGQPGMPNRNPDISQRIRYFEKALTYSKAAQGISADGQHANLDISRLHDEYDVAKLQQQVYQSLAEDTKTLEYVQPTTFGNVSTTNEAERRQEVEERRLALETLNWTLKDPSDLYNDFAFRFGLWEACIQIIKECKCDDSDELHTLYKRIVRQAAGPYRDVELHQLIRPLSAKIVELGNKFYDNASGAHSSSFVFPYEYLIQGLEDLSTFYPPSRHATSTRDWTPWVLDTMLEINIPFERLFQAYSNYNNKIQSGSPPLGMWFLSDGDDDDVEWYSERSKFNVAWAIVTLVRKYRDDFAKKGQEVVFDVRVGDLLERLSVIVGGLHSEDVTEYKRKQLLDALAELLQTIHG